MSMEKLSEKDLEKMPKNVLISMIMGLQTSVNELNRTVSVLSEQIRVMNQRSYGRKSEQVSALQMELELGFNEAEKTEDPSAEEPSLEEAAPKRKRPAGKRQEDIKKITNHRTVPVEIDKSELDREYSEKADGKDCRIRSLQSWNTFPLLLKLSHTKSVFMPKRTEIRLSAP